MNETFQTRREFLNRLLFLTAGASAPFFLSRTTWALDEQPAGAMTRSLPGMRDGRILVVIQLGGGNDGLNTVVPYAMDEYHRARRTLGLVNDRVLKLTDVIGLHPGLGKLRALYDRGRLAIVQGVGYPNPDRSHFRSMDIWQTADPASAAVTCGWLGRYLDNACPGCDPRGKRVNPMAGINIGGWMPVALKSARGLSIALNDPDSFRWQPLAGSERDRQQSAETFARLNRVVARNLADPQVARLDFLSRVAMNAQLSSDRVRDVARKFNRGQGGYPPTGLGRQLQQVSQFIACEMPTRLYYVSLGGFDTHANQSGAHERLLNELAEACAAFDRDLENRDQAGQVLVMTFSEFGRRVAENASGGTDHGAAAPLFVFGGKVKGGIYGAHPSLAADQLDRGDVRFHTDFRQVYATVLENWLGAKAPPILGGAFAKLKFV